MRRLTLILALALVFSGAAHATIPAKELPRAANRAAGGPATLVCKTAKWWNANTPPGALAFTRPGTPDRHIYLSPTVCGWIRYANDPSTAGHALLILTHEAMHLRFQSGDEGLTECRALNYLIPGGQAALYARHTRQSLKRVVAAIRALDRTAPPAYHTTSTC